MGTLRKRRTSDELIEDVAGPDDRNAPWYRVVAEIRDLRASGECAWADATLEGIATTIERTQAVTPAQGAALIRISRTARTPSRNFDAYGYGRRW